jgi:F-type H+-transporting ATPase subunit c
MSFRKILGVVGLFSLTFASVAMAQETGGADAGTYGALASAIAIGIAVLGGALGQGRAATAALEGIARNPAAQNKIFTPMIIAMALIESLVLMAFVIAFVKIKG